LQRTPDPVAKKYYDMGTRLFEQDKHEEAVACYTRAIEEDSEYGSAYFNRALSYALMSKYQEAAKDAKSVLQLEPDSYDGPYVLGVICEHQRDYKGAAEWYRKSLGKKPDYTPARVRLRDLEERMRPKIMTPEERIDIELDDESDIHLPRGENMADSEPQPGKAERTVIIDGQIKGLALGRPRKKMEDVIGLDHVKRELELTVIGPAKRAGALKRWNLDSGLSVILYGPSGCGKTHLAEAIAGEIDAYILVFNLNEVMDMYSGNTEKNIHTIFQQARDLIAEGKARYVVVFIDELDALGLNRAFDREMSCRRAAINQLLMELDGVGRNPEGLIIVGATNRPWDIDPALKRAGRFGDEWYVAIPSLQERKSLFEFYMRGVPADDIGYQKLARATKAYSPADIKRVVRIAKFRAMEREGSSEKETVVTTEDLMEAIRNNQASSLYNWFVAIEEEFASKPLDRKKYGRMVDDMVTVLGRRAKPNQSGDGDSAPTPRTRRKQSIPAYA
jgi:SpoVK/Ycf46/Vps4 family AAA+-type ATPase